jgi:hypothetical protein
MRIERTRGGEVRFGGGRVAAPRGDLAREREGPGAHGRVVAGARQLDDEAAVGRVGILGEARGARVARRDDERARAAHQPRAVLARRGIAALHGEHGGACQHCLPIAGARDDAVEVGERAVEVVLALPESGAQEDAAGRRIDVRPPRRQRSLRRAQETRVAAGARRLDRAARVRARKLEIAWIGGQSRAHALERLERRIDLLRQALEDRVVACRNVRGRLRHRGDGEQHQ